MTDNLESMMKKLIKLHPLDNVQILIAEIDLHEEVVINGQQFQMDNNTRIGDKIADRHIEPGEKIIKYGVSIGSATEVIETGKHVHLHNMKSDYIPTYTIEKSFKEKDS